MPLVMIRSLEIAAGQGEACRPDRGRQVRLDGTRHRQMCIQEASY